MRQEEFRAAIFDLDGTLVDSMWIWDEIDVDYMNRHGLPFEKKLQEDIAGMSFHETAVYFKERFDIPESIEEIQREWNDMAIEYYRTRVRLKEGAKEYLRQLRERGVKTGIATSNSWELLDAVLDATGLRECMDSIHSACEIRRGKPAPDIYLLVARDLDVAPEDCMVFEDILPGIEAGHNAGMRVCSVYDRYAADHAEEIAARAEHHIHSFTELLDDRR